VGAYRARARLVFEALAIREAEVRLADVLDEPVASPEVVRWLVGLLIAENEVPIEEFLTLLHLALEHRAKIVLIADDVRREDEQKVRLARPLGRAPEEESEHRDVAENRDLVVLPGHCVAHQSADDDRLLIVDDDRRLRVALGDRHRPQRTRCSASLGDLFGELEPHLVGVIDVGNHLDLGSINLVVVFCGFRGPIGRVDRQPAIRQCRLFHPVAVDPALAAKVGPLRMKINQSGIGRIGPEHDRLTALQVADRNCSRAEYNVSLDDVRLNVEPV